MPSVPPLQLLGPAASTPHVPTTAPAATLQTPPQQSPAWAQMSPVCAQNEDARSQTPPVQYFEQQSLLLAQVLPLILHVVSSVTHAPLVQVPLQQLALDEHG